MGRLLIFSLPLYLYRHRHQLVKMGPTRLVARAKRDRIKKKKKKKLPFQQKEKRQTKDYLLGETLV